MKKQLLFLLFALLALCASAAPNDVFSVGDITYSVTLDSYSGKPGIVAVKSLSAQGKAKTSLKLDIPGVVSYNGYKYKVGVINYDAFKGQSNISVVQIRYNITRIAQSAFENCTSLTTVYMPSSLTNVGYRAFGGCTALRSVYYANATPSSTSVVPGSFPENSGMTLYVSKAHPNSVENARKVTAFDYFSTIKKHEYACDFILGEHGYFCVTKAPLSDGSTRGEMSLVGAYADNNFNYAWSGAYNDGIFDFDVVEIADSACLGNTNIKNVYLSSYSKLRRIGDSAFNGCSSIEWVQMATSSLQQIGKYAFKGCNLLTTIKLPENVYSCSAYFVDGCTKLGYISVDSKSTNYASYNGILYDKGLTYLYRCPEGYTYRKVLDSNSLPPTLKKVGNYAFEYCKYVEEIYFPYGLTSFGVGTFRYCSGLTTLQLPSSHTGWGEGSFVGATALDVLYVNQEDAYGLEVSRRVNEFDDCKRGTLYVGGWITSFNWGPWAKWKNCKREAYDYLATNGLRYTIINGYAQTVDGEKFDGSAKLFYAPHNTGKSEIVIQDYITLPGGKKYAVTSVGTHVFGTGNTLSVKTNLTLGKHVRTIEEQAFLDQTNLVGLKLNPNLKVIGVNGFGNCRIATDVILPCGFTTLESHAFYNNSFKRILIPSSVTKMDSKCIAKNNYLQEIILNNAQFAYNYIDLENVPKSSKLYVPAGSEEAFKKNQYWGTLQVMEGAYDFTYQDADPYNTIYHMSVISHSPFTIDGVTYAGRARYVYHPANKDRTNITQFTATFSETDYTHGANKKYMMTGFGDRALDMCTQIQNVETGKMKAFVHIGRRAFANTSIKNFEVPDTCVYLGDEAFVGCRQLSELVIWRNKNWTRKWGKQLYGQNAKDFYCYVPLREYNTYKEGVLDWEKLEGETIFPVDRLNAYIEKSSISDDRTISVDYPVDWKASGLKAYVVHQFDQLEQMAYTKQVSSTPAGTGLLLKDFDNKLDIKLKRPSTTPSTPTNLLVGTPRERVDVYRQSVGYVFDSRKKFFYRPRISEYSEVYSAYLKLSSFQAGSVTHINIDLYSQITGDINGDGEVNVSDVTALINKILGSSTYSDAVCDINGDGEINVSDVTALINLILK